MDTNKMFENDQEMSAILCKNAIFDDLLMTYVFQILHTPQSLLKFVKI